MHLDVTDSRRLTGPNLLLHGAGAVIEVVVDGVGLDETVERWRHHVTDLCARVGLPAPRFGVRPHPGGAALAFSAPIDVLYAATDINDLAWQATVADVMGGGLPGVEGRVEALREELAKEANPALLALAEAAEERGVPLLWDDDEVSLGLGRAAKTWAWGDLPSPDDVEWDARQAVPVVLVTGTNGKSTTVRMLARVLRAAGIAAGLTSTDGIHVGDEVVDRGDYSGPGGARTLLRHAGVEAAVLEVARGGMLRRGLPVERADVAIVTNIADDHLGEYGIETLDDLAEAKLLLGRAIHDDGLLILNADDPMLVAHAPDDVPLGWTSLRSSNPVVAEHVEAGGTAWVVRDGEVVERTSAGDLGVVAVADVPATLGGAARHNVANVLGVVGAARRLGLEPATIAAGLRAFRGDGDDNPGRANVFDLDGARIVVDFAHNPAGMAAIAETAGRMPAKRRLVMFGQAGDRSDASIRDLVDTVWATAPDRIVAMDVPNYLRGRQPGEIPRLIAEHLGGLGAPPDVLDTAPSPLEGVRQALAWAEAGDLLLLMVLDDRQQALDLLREAGATPA